MQANTIYATATAVVLLFFLACTGRKKQDFGFLIDQTASNKEEVRKMVANYLRASGEEEKEAYAYILTHLQDQYRIHFQLEKAGKTVLLNGNIGMDSVLFLQREGFALNCRDTVRDMDVISATDLHEHVQRFVKNRKNQQSGIKLSFPAYLKYALPYRTNNEPPEANFRINARYSVPRLIRTNAAKDTIDRIRKKISAIAGLYSHNLNGVNLLNTFDPETLLLRKEGALLSDHDDRFVFEIGMLRQTGVPAVALFCPHRRHGANRPYSVHIVKEDHDIDSLKVENAAKLYVSSFEAKDWDNPFDRLHALGVKKEDIPLSLYVPKMKDVTAQATATGEVRYSISSQTTTLLAKPAVYLCTYSLGQWLPIDFSLVDGNEARFSRIGTGVLYTICAYVGGKLIPVSDPLTLDGPKKQIEITGSNTIIKATLKQEGNNKPLRKNTAYSLYVWNSESGWVHLKGFTTGEKETSTADVPENRLYLVKHKGSSFFDPRPFTLGEDGRQVWW